MTRQPYRVIPLSGKTEYVTIIDASDFKRVSRHRWHVHRSRGTRKKPGQPYARTTIKGKKVYLHQFLLGCPPNSHIDHINFFTLDNRKENLRALPPETNGKRRRNTRHSTKIVVDTPSTPKI